MGSKLRIAKEIIPLLELHRYENYYEPFVGGGNFLQFVTHPNRNASDSCPYAVGLLKAVSEGWIPPDKVTEEEYYEVKKQRFMYPYHYTGFIMYCCSYAAKPWGGYARGKNSKGQDRNYALEQKKALLKQAPLLKGVNFTCCSYDDVIYKPRSVIYCDPPYQNTTGYKQKFDSEKFFTWCRDMTCLGHKVFVSEFNCPSDFKLIWEKERVTSLTKDTGSKRSIERLYTLC